MLRRLGPAGAAVAVAFGASACQITSPVQTSHVYSPADGVLLDAGSLEIADLLVVSEGDGAPGVVSGYAVNTGQQPLTVQLSVAPEGAAPEPLSPSVELAPGTALRLDGDRGVDSAELSYTPVMVPSVEPRAGLTVTLRVSTSEGDVASTLVPILFPDPPYDIYDEALGAAG